MGLSATQHILGSLGIGIDVGDVFPEGVLLAEHRREVHVDSAVVERVPALLGIAVREVAVGCSVPNNLINAAGQYLVYGHLQLLGRCQECTIDIHCRFASNDRTVIQMRTRRNNLIAHFAVAAKLHGFHFWDRSTACHRHHVHIESIGLGTMEHSLRLEVAFRTLQHVLAEQVAERQVIVIAQSPVLSRERKRRLYVRIGHTLVHVVITIPDVGSQIGTGGISSAGFEYVDEIGRKEPVGTEFIAVVEDAAQWTSHVFSQSGPSAKPMVVVLDHLRGVEMIHGETCITCSHQHRLLHVGHLPECNNLPVVLVGQECDTTILDLLCQILDIVGIKAHGGPLISCLLGRNHGNHLGVGSVTLISSWQFNGLLIARNNADHTIFQSLIVILLRHVFATRWPSATIGQIDNES